MSKMATRNGVAAEDSLRERARSIWVSVLQVRADERLAVVTDDEVAALGSAFYRAGSDVGCEIVHVIMPRLVKGAAEPVGLAGLALRECEAYVAITSAGSRSITHSRARHEASRGGARGLTLPRMTKEMLMRDAVAANYHEIALGTEALAAALNGSDSLRVTSKGGTDLMLDVHGGEWFAERGLCERPGDFSNLPGGEVSIAPVDAEGVVVVDGSITPFGQLESPLEIVIEQRRIVSIQGDRAQELSSFLEKYGPGGFNVAEIGIGMNPMARPCGRVLEDEKVLGTIHIGVGDNSHMGGKSVGEVVAVDVHIDGVVVSDPKLCADGSVINPREFINA